MPEIVIDGHHVTTEGYGNGFRILVDGHPVPMTFAETKTTVGNSEPRTVEIHRRWPVVWLPPAPWLADADTDIFGSRAVRLHFSRELVYIHNTGVYDAENVLLEFDPAYTKVDVSWDHYCDYST
jgi:hypothetical protein